MIASSVLKTLIIWSRCERVRLRINYNVSRHFPFFGRCLFLW
ncbi:hypothetical protein HMPREF1336_02299 [Enterococcus faecalis ERV63]|uniref:Uncharacterized protein n=1 Tax=Enterococcus faecalis ERV63 TaxID=1134793 RepID=A0AAV3GIX0_ENTFL|nr:hypothetical protein HMPREF1336_02299 [Enterococcus faecalis ERV63]